MRIDVDSEVHKMIPPTVQDIRSFDQGDHSGPTVENLMPIHTEGDKNHPWNREWCKVIADLAQQRLDNRQRRE